MSYSDRLDTGESPAVPLWILVIGAVAGILQLVVLIILWKLCFFKRKRPDPTLTGNFEKEKERLGGGDIS